MYLFSGLEIFDSSDRRRSDDGSSRRYVGAGGGAGLQREKPCLLSRLHGGERSGFTAVAIAQLLSRLHGGELTAGALFCHH